MDLAKKGETIRHGNKGAGTEWTFGRYIARRLVEIGVRDVFSVPGDFNLLLLDHLVAEPQLQLIGCCNELNAGYAADGYARAHGVGVCVVTFTVGGLSVINAIAGAYSENFPVICIVGGPNSNDFGTNRIIHHTIGESDFGQEHSASNKSHVHRFEQFHINHVSIIWGTKMTKIYVIDRLTLVKLNVMIQHESINYV